MEYAGISQGLALLCLPFGMLCGVLTVPPVRILARAVGGMDVPRDGRRMHTDTVPRLGGISVLLPFSVVCALLFGRELAVLALTSIAVGFLGAMDDIFHLSAKVKLICESLVALSAVLGGIRFGGSLGAAALSFFVLVLFPNALNLSDGLDGLAGGAAAISALGIALLAYTCGDGAVFLLSLFLAGGCLGFLAYNRAPACIFLGDCGSLGIGHLLGVLLLLLYGRRASSFPLLPQASLHPLPLAVGIFLLPTAELVFTACRRLYRRRSLFSADRGHFHHILVDGGFSVNQAAGLLLLLHATAVFITVANAVALGWV